MVNHDEEQVLSGEELVEEKIYEEDSSETTIEESEAFLGDQIEKENMRTDEAMPPSQVLTHSHQQSPHFNTG